MVRPKHGIYTRAALRATAAAASRLQYGPALPTFAMEGGSHAAHEGLVRILPFGHPQQVRASLARP